MMSEPEFTLGIEEEYMLVDPETRDLVTDPNAALLEDCKFHLSDRVSPEFLRFQIEGRTGPCRTIDDARQELTDIRRTVAQAARAQNYRIICASTHPFAHWSKQMPSDHERYKELAEQLQGVARRLAISGLHVHVGIGDPELRLDLLGQVSYFLPHLLALSTSSPFWHGDLTGLMSYRLGVWDELPRTGLPDPFDSWSEYQRHVDILVRAGLIEDASKIWWDVRPAVKFPTLELRITDACTRLEDTLTIAALFACLLRMLYRLRRNNQRWRRYARMLLMENRWRAQRYGIDAGLIDFGKGEMVPYPDLLDELLDLIAEDAEALDCRREVAAARDIPGRGTSAHNQIAVYQQALANGAEPTEALRAVVDWLADETEAGLARPGGD